MNAGNAHREAMQLLLIEYVQECNDSDLVESEESKSDISTEVNANNLGKNLLIQIDFKKIGEHEKSEILCSL